MTSNGRATLRPAPCRPLSFATQGPASAQIVLDGTAKQHLETGRTRLLFAAMVFTVAFAVIGLRLVGLSLTQEPGSPRIAATSPHNPFESLRADIVDRNGVVLATTLPAVSLYADPRQIISVEEATRGLMSVLPELSAAEVAEKLQSERAFVWLKRHLTPRQQQDVNSLGLPGLHFKREAQRVYPHGALTAHLLGLADIDNQGIAGLEQSFEKRLTRDGQPLALSLDIRVQHILSEELAAAMTAFRATGAAGLVLDVQTGEVVAMASLPSYDPTQIDRADDEARFNRASLGIYEMGSVFKIFTTAMALDRGAVRMNDGYDVSKPIRVARFTITDYKPKNRWLSVPEIFIYSSNIGTVQMAMDSGTPALRGFMDDLGLTRAATLELPEVGQPMVPSPWREINTMTISYGHGLAVSPLQVANAVSAVVNGGELKPATLLKRADGVPVPGRRVIDRETSRDMRWLMRLAVQSGTGRKADAPGYLVGGKTGTADKLRGKSYSRNSRIASFVGAFPMDAPRYVVLAMIDEPKGQKQSHGFATGGWVAAPVVGRVIERMGPMVGILPRSLDTEERAVAHLVPASFKGNLFASD